MYASRAFIASEIKIDFLALVRFLDTPVDHVAKRRELVHARLELRERLRMCVGGKGMAHRAGHSRVGEHGIHLFRGRGIAVEQEVAFFDLLHEGFLVSFQLLGCYRVLIRIGRADENQQSRPADQRSEAMQRANRNVVLVVIAVLPSTARSGRRSAAAGSQADSARSPAATERRPPYGPT